MLQLKVLDGSEKSVELIRFSLQDSCQRLLAHREQRTGAFLPEFQERITVP